MITGSVRPDSVVYALVGATRSYIGVSSHAHARAGASRLGLLDARHWEHMRHLVRPDRRGGVHKLRVLRLDPVGSLSTFVVQSGDSLRMEALERLLIRSVAPVANAQGAFVRGWRRPTPGAKGSAERGRPPPRMRAPQSSCRTPVEAVVPMMLKAMVEIQAERRRALQALASRRVQEMSFDEAYSLYRLTPHGAAIGPVDLRAPECFELRMSLLCTRDRHIPWGQWRQALGLRGLYALGFGLLELRRAGRRLLGIRRWRAFMEGIGEPGWSLPVVSLPRSATPGARHAVRQRLVALLADGDAARRSWVQLRLRVVMGPAETYARARMRMSSVSRVASLAELDAATPQGREGALQGADLVRVKRYWKPTLLQFPMSRLSRGVDALIAWFRQWQRHDRSGATMGHAKAQRLAEFLAAPLLSDPPAACSDAYREYVSALPQAGVDQVVVIEDKDTSSAWLSSRCAYLIRSLHFVLQDWSWVRSALSPDGAARAVMEAHRPLVESGVLRPTSLDRWAAGLPSLYTTQTAKCWQDGARCCTREKHSCVRRICSWARMPGRPLLRLLGKAWRVAVLRSGHGAGTASLATGASDLRARSAALVPGRDPRSCCRCAAPKLLCVGIVMDASSMYEQVPPDQVLQAADVLLRALRSRGFRGILVRAGRRLQGRLWRHPGAYQDTWRFVTFADMRHVLAASLSVRYAFFAGAVFGQARGMPIGGPLSDLGAALLLGMQEAAWRQHLRLRRLAGFGA